MAIVELLSSAVIGSLKTSLKRAALKAASQIAQDKISGITVFDLRGIQKRQAIFDYEKIGRNALDDAKAALLIRLKVRPDTALLNYAAKELDITTGQVRTLLRNFTPTPKQRQLGLAKNFTKFASRQLTKNLQINKLPKNKIARINEIIKAAQRDIDAVVRDNKRFDKGVIEKERTENERQEIINGHVRERLAAIEKALRERIEGATGAQDAYKKNINFYYGIENLFDASKDYSREQVSLLDDILDTIYNDIENYDYGSGDDVAIINDDGEGWQVTSKKNIERFIKDRYDDVKRFLNVQ